MTLESTGITEERPTTSQQPSKKSSIEENGTKTVFNIEQDEIYGRTPRTYSHVASQVDMATCFSRSGYGFHLSMSHNSSLTDMSQIDIMDYGSYNVTTANLRNCKENILIPYLRLLKFVGWRPFADDRYYRHWWIDFLNLVYPILILLVLLFNYGCQIVECWWKLNVLTDTMSQEHHTTVHPTVNSSNLFRLHGITNPILLNGTDRDYQAVNACKHVIPTYLVTAILHLSTFIMGVVYFRYYGDEQACGLLEKVFLEIESLRHRNVCHNILVRNFRIFMGFGVVWVLMTMCLQGLYCWAYSIYIFPVRSPHSFLLFGLSFVAWLVAVYVVCSLMDGLLASSVPFCALTKTGSINWFLLILEIIGILMMNSVSLAAVCNYVVQCEAIILFVKCVSLRFLDSGLELPRGMKHLVEIKYHLKALNGNTGKMTSLVTLIFAVLTVIGVNMLFMNDDDQLRIWIYRGLFPVVWGIMLSAPLIQAARINSVCKRFHNDALTFAANGYKALPQTDLDSYVLFTSNAKLRARLFAIPILPSYLIGITVSSCFILLILFQTNVLQISRFMKI